MEHSAPEPVEGGRSTGSVNGRRGRHKVFLGMAAGVGKTYRMLQEGHAEKEAGRDVAIGYLETHRRPETAAMSTGLEMIPRRTVAYRDSELEDMDLPAVLARAPELCLIDEIAHTNAPGLEHDKRHEDVADVVDAGIDVFSTVNVQHLESLNDQVAELTGVRVRETMPPATQPLRYQSHAHRQSPLRPRLPRAQPQLWHEDQRAAQSAKCRYGASARR